MRENMVLKTSDQLKLCILNEVTVEILIGGVTDYVGKIKSVSNEVVEVEDGKYLRRNCIIRLKK